MKLVPNNIKILYSMPDACNTMHDWRWQGESGRVYWCTSLLGAVADPLCAFNTVCNHDLTNEEVVLSTQHAASPS